MSHQPPDALHFLSVPLPSRFLQTEQIPPPPPSLLTLTAPIMSGEGQDEQPDDTASQFGGPGAPTPLAQLEVYYPLPPSLGNAVLIHFIDCRGMG